jgi:DNA repair exonuclease SbcCD ATPase subunit
MYSPKKIVIQDWLSFKGTHEYEFKAGEAVLIVGENKTDDGQSSNGAGKSAIHNAVCYLLTGSCRGVRDVKLINRDTDKSTITIILQSSDHKLLITRQLFKSKSSKLHIELDSVEQEFSSINEGNKLILTILGISSEDLQNYFIVDRRKYISFYESSDTRKKELISRFSNVQLLDGVNPKLDIKYKEFDAQLKTKQDLKITYEATINVLQNQLENISDEVDCSDLITVLQQDGGQIVNYLANITKYENDISEYEKQRQFIHSSTILTLQKQIDSFSEVDYSKEIENTNIKLTKTRRDLDVIESRLNSAKESKAEFSSIINELKTKLAGEIECPACQHHFILKDDIDVEEAKQLLEEARTSVEEMQFLINSNTEEYKVFGLKESDILNMIKDFENKERINKQEKIVIEGKMLAEQSKVAKLDYSIGMCNDQLTSCKQRIEDIKSHTKTIELQIEQRKQDSNKKQKEELQDKISVEKIELDLLFEKIDDIKAKLAQVESWRILFKKFRSYLTNQSLNIIQGYTNLYLKKMHTNLQVLFEGYKVLSTGELKENITAEILRNGMREGEFLEFSGGERGRLELAVMLSLQQLINISTNNKGLDFLGVDEVLDAVDSSGMSNIIESLDNVKKTVMLISHVNIQKSHNTMTIEKVNGNSKIIL